jgi:conjugative transfer signal peptidase TraF
MNRQSRWRVLAIMLVGLALLLASVTVGAHPLLVWNATASAPIGLYRVRSIGNRPLRIGELLLIRPDAASARLYAERGYLPLGVALLKRVVAVADQRVCERDGVLSIDGRRVANALPTDGRGRPLVAWSGCRRLCDGELFALMADVLVSLDGRYFGPTPIRSVIGRATPLWILDEHR